VGLLADIVKNGWGVAGGGRGDVDWETGQPCSSGMLHGGLCSTRQISIDTILDTGI